MKQDGLPRVGQRLIQCIAHRKATWQIGHHDAVRVFGIARLNCNGISHNLATLPQTSLLSNRSHQAFAEILLRMRNRNSARLRRMHELVVAAASSLKLPAIRLQELDQLATLHRVYYTHREMAPRRNRSV